MKSSSDLKRIAIIAKRLEIKFHKAEGPGRFLSDSVAPSIKLEAQEEDKLKERENFKSGFFSNDTGYIKVIGKLFGSGAIRKAK